MRTILTAAAAVAFLASGHISVAQGGPVPAASSAMHPSDAEVADWFRFRRTKWAETEAADPNQAAELAAIKARAAAAVATAGPMATSLDAPPVIWPTGRAAPLVIHDDPVAPRMVVVPAGEFTMGSRDGEPGRVASEGPRRRVRIAHPLAVGMFSVVYGEYALFVADTHRRASGPCVAAKVDKSVARAGRDWRDLGYPQTVRHPVVCVSFDDATAYAAWLSVKTGHRYRLLSEAEYEYANRAGTTAAHWWGNDVNAACAYANGFDEDGKAANPLIVPISCHDGYAFTAPVGSLKPNAFGLFDTTGNAWSWTADSGRHGGAPVGGSAASHGTPGLRVLRGGSWASLDLRSAGRVETQEQYTGADIGFRVAREL